MPKQSLLNHVFHAPLINKMGHYTRRCGVSPEHVHYSMREFGCQEWEVNYVREYVRHKDNPLSHPWEKRSGLIYLDEPNLVSRMRGVAGAFMRKYVEARVVTVSGLLHALEYDLDPYDSSVVIIPDFFQGSKAGELFPNQLFDLIGYVSNRIVQNKQTVLGIFHLDRLVDCYGPYVGSLIADNFYTKEAYLSKETA